MRSVRKEKWFWRDEKISQRHRDWGWHLPMVDIDFLVVEYYYSKPKALIEYKSEHAKNDYTGTSYRTLENLANAANIFFFVVKYKNDFSSWTITPMNKHAQKYFNGNETKILSEEAYVELLYKIRGRSLPENIKQELRRLSSSTRSRQSNREPEETDDLVR